MPDIVVMGAMIQCKYGTAPGKLTVTPAGSPSQSANQMIATVMDHVPMVNIMTFGTCSSPTNPATKNPSGTAPCVPATTAPWSPGSATVTVAGSAALTSDSTCMCTLGTPGVGDISITQAGQSGVSTG